MIETKETHVSNKGYINDLTAFGWQKTQETSRRSGRNTYYYQIMARDTSMPNYDEYCKYEEIYEDAKSNRQVYDSMDEITVLLLLLLFIFPGVLYISYKTKEKNRIIEHNKWIDKKMEEAVEAARKIR
jgi:hypothetical protein